MGASEVVKKSKKAGAKNIPEKRSELLPVSSGVFLFSAISASVCLFIIVMSVVAAYSQETRGIVSEAVEVVEQKEATEPAKTQEPVYLWKLLPIDLNIREYKLIFDDYTRFKTIGGIVANVQHNKEATNFRLESFPLRVWLKEDTTYYFRCGKLTTPFEVSIGDSIIFATEKRINDDVYAYAVDMRKNCSVVEPL